jgi:F0F1-type ATP synthase membrane subunit c/vacuolar-type H+-ATPase subunit K
MGRNPEVADKLFTNMLIAMAVCESTAIYALLVAFVILLG